MRRLRGKRLENTCVVLSGAENERNDPRSAEAASATCLLSPLSSLSPDWDSKNEAAAAAEERFEGAEESNTREREREGERQKEKEAAASVLVTLATLSFRPPRERRPAAGGGRRRPASSLPPRGGREEPGAGPLQKE